ncbi:MAG: hypothetical protein QGF74_02645 [Candidatus Nanoarchaeia archaeon]|jgi:hypothetical protein|nr:hypothetical protein [Candidatus Nanoarchaeia archaeon]|tara:strand:- start:21572 stop:21724 length:153 start_codon:yes stop_codon:yes gene_type:complete
MALEEQIVLILYILLGAVAGMIYALRRIFILERRILEMDQKLVTALKKKR